MASARSPRRQLAPTVGHEVALDGVHIRAGVLEISGERTVSALVQSIYAMDFINDNAGCFTNGGIFPKNGRIIEFGSHRIYFGTVPVRQCLSPVLVASDPPRWLCAGRAAGSVEVMMTGVAGAGKEVAVKVLVTRFRPVRLSHRWSAAQAQREHHPRHRRHRSRRR